MELEDELGVALSVDEPGVWVGGFFAVGASVGVGFGFGIGASGREGEAGRPAEADVPDEADGPEECDNPEECDIPEEADRSPVDEVGFAGVADGVATVAGFGEAGRAGRGASPVGVDVVGIDDEAGEALD